jgi:hypothetical protein
MYFFTDDIPYFVDDSFMRIHLRVDNLRPWFPLPPLCCGACARSRWWRSHYFSSSPFFFNASGVPIVSTSNSFQHACSPVSAIARCIIRMDITGRDPLFDDDEEDPELQNQSVHSWTHTNEFRVSSNAALHFLLWVCQVWVAWSELEKHNNRTKSNSFMEVMGVNAGIRGQ